MSTADEFRAHAEHMERLARGARTDAEREVFMGFATTWRQLADESEYGRRRLAEPPPRPSRTQYLTHAVEMEERAKAAKTGEERELFRDFAARWRQLADELSAHARGVAETRPRH
ncbi:hypothetical protein [Caulobacter sp. 17J65-9]|uniref:hypothetical protein n=1 Tax=Caulobacter sp. 17J65-9 TaxID=2709382 RepID=UPI0013CC1E3B|nr:hypothetical protein [Caulobacter sp. 17J65-9]NEX91583.1 hypothetical protein [Caulobacter sp. 17J65-9]